MDGVKDEFLLVQIFLKCIVVASYLCVNFVRAFLIILNRLSSSVDDKTLCLDSQENSMKTFKQ